MTIEEVVSALQDAVLEQSRCAKAETEAWTAANVARQEAESASREHDNARSAVGAAFRAYRAALGVTED